MNILNTLLESIGIYKGKSNWNYDVLHEKLVSGGGVIPISYVALPTLLSMQPVFWQQTKYLRDYTEKDMHEYAVSVWWADGEIIVSPPQRGDLESVNTEYSVRLEYVPNDTMYAIKTVYINEQVVLTQSIRYEDIPKESVITMLFHMHTHPPHFVENERRYSFFSAVDIRSFLSGNTAISGIITNKLYLLVKPVDVVKSVPEFTDEDITANYLRQVLGIAIYEGDWNTAIFEKFVE
jgi:hypothetical protein